MYILIKSLVKNMKEVNVQCKEQSNKVSMENSGIGNCMCTFYAIHVAVYSYDVRKCEKRDYAYMSASVYLTDTQGSI